MKIDGFDDDQIAEILKMWNLGAPIDVRKFLKREDIPTDAKRRVNEAGRSSGISESAQAEAFRNMQAQIILEVVNLDRQRWRP